ncbi:MAG: penicillin-binding protein 1A [Gammaproteobacteria bacterium]|jgi:penicillin-binding protein 1A
MKNLIKMVCWASSSSITAVLFGMLYVYSVLIPQLPSIEHLEETKLKVPLRIYDRNELLLAEFGEYRRIPVSFESIPEHVVNAFVTAEDDQFWSHFGVDPSALAAAVYEVVTTGNKTRGGSTITMQLARNFFLSSEQTYSRKINEILLALKIEKELSKEKIIELYVNKIYLGHRSYGIEAASQVYYNKPLGELSIAQAAMIAGLPKAPSKYNPIINPERALSRRNHILRRMHSLGYIDDEPYDMARTEAVTAELHASQRVADATFVAEMVRSQLFEQYGDEVYENGLNVYTTIDGRLQNVANDAMRHALMDYTRRHGYRGPIGSLDLEAIDGDPFDAEKVTDQRVGGLRKGVVTAINESSVNVLISDYENIEVPFKDGIDWAAEQLKGRKPGKKPESVSDVLAIGNVIWLENRSNGWMLADIPQVEGALVSIDSNDGAIRSLVGGFDYFRNKFNRVTQARRQPGSNFKPFIYSAALEKGFTAASIINDAPVVFDDDSLESTWRPENYSGRVYGPTRFREALVKSRNLVSIRVLQSTGLRYATDYVQRFGFKKENIPYDLSLSLGSGTFAPMEIVRGYAVFSNGGYLVDPYFISRIETGEGEVIYQHQALSVCQSCEEDAKAVQVSESADSSETGSEQEQIREIAYAPRVISAQNAYIMRSIMREVVQRGTAVKAKALGRKDIGGKTGTTNDQIDAWFSGFNDHVVTTAWVGNDNQTTLGSRETGGKAALPMWVEYMKAALEGSPENIESQPEGLVTVRIDAETGKRATLGSGKTIFEIFREEYAPEELKVVKTGSKGSANNSIVQPETEEEIVEDIF